jgi:predicted RNase H-like HicB family nuclease
MKWKVESETRLSERPRGDGGNAIAVEHAGLAVRAGNLYNTFMTLAIAYTTQLWREGDQFIAHAMPLDIASSGTTQDEARKALEEAVHLFLETAMEHGTLDQVLEDSGYVQDGESWLSPAWLAVEQGEAVLTV